MKMNDSTPFQGIIITSHQVDDKAREKFFPLHTKEWGNNYLV
jgi:hypothetical protein